ncbi:DTDP-4-dehydrorhamnose reductase [Herbaspirillum frisingense GSF30]|uniref:dTDP-4-dehydrorhamnose reductase n=1 Tax=Herbaspirillum frisingense GSF30 TaxID=864073 RepID=A0AAI9IE84_9BURK|nr:MULTISPECIES: dTDP-4-dehydrorhamnose reductase [Herbaspirillum]EOA04516.1 DTDP-4-dehydrorhamnose reductase [Herbaspirillum frisingense GSF30]MCI1014381.1 dTDP-4-dehydrorhamnose reductase [Herbaspirillum sp. C7C2]
MKILLFGCNGQLGWELQRSLAPLGQLISLSACSEQYCGDLADMAGISRTIAALRPDVVVNAAAYTAVDKAQSEPERAHLVNAEAPGAMALAAAQCGALLVHYSTDYVFDGSGEHARKEDEATGPLNVYGRTKLEGEQAIVASGCAHLIFRTSWVYAARGGNFAKTMLRLGAQRDELNVIDDQTGAPTGAELLADASAHAIVQTLAHPERQGLYHLAASGQTTWFAYARKVFALAGQLGGLSGPARLVPIPTSAYPTQAARPLNSRLDCSKFQAAFGLILPDWQNGVERMMKELHEH